MNMDLPTILTIAYAEIDDAKDVNTNVRAAAKAIHKALEQRITSGELMVVKTVRIINPGVENDSTCSCCGRVYPAYQEADPSPGQFCTCGAKIIQ